MLSCVRVRHVFKPAELLVLIVASFPRIFRIHDITSEADKKIFSNRIQAHINNHFIESGLGFHGQVCRAICSALISMDNQD